MLRSLPLLLLAFPVLGLFAVPQPPGAFRSPLGLTSAHASSAILAQPLVSNAVIPEPLGTARASLYLSLGSQDEVDDALLAVEVEGVERVTLHRTQLEGGVARMAAVESVDLPSGDAVQLRPGGLHVMLEDLGRSWQPGEAVRLRLHFRRAGTVDAFARVIAFPDLLNAVG